MLGFSPEEWSRVGKREGASGNKSRGDRYGG